MAPFWALFGNLGYFLFQHLVTLVIRVSNAGIVFVRVLITPKIFLRSLQNIFFSRKRISLNGHIQRASSDTQKIIIFLFSLPHNERFHFLCFMSLSLFMLMWAFIPSSSLTVESISWPEQRRCRSKPSQTAFQFHRPDTARKAVRRVDVAEARMISWAGEPAERGKERKGESVYVCVKERERERERGRELFQWQQVLAFATVHELFPG